jgi:arylsulfatase A-like enzyme
LTDNTLLIFTSDNGGLAPKYTSNEPYRLGKSNPYEGGIRIPQIVRWPGHIKPGSTCDVPVSSIDFFPTIAEAASAQLPDREIDGVSMMPLLTQSGGIGQRDLFWHRPRYNKTKPSYSIIRSGKWKMIYRYHGDTKYELFNIESDISEKNNLAQTTPEKVKELEAKLKAWTKHVGTKVPRAGK